MVDSEETCVLVMVYNTANSWGVLIGDTVVIPEPLVKRNIITHKDEVSVSWAQLDPFIGLSSWSNVHISFLAVVWLQKYTSGLSSAPHRQRQETEHAQSDGYVSQLQASGGMSWARSQRKDLFVFLLDLEEFWIIDVKMDALALPHIAQINVEPGLPTLPVCIVVTWKQSWSTEFLPISCQSWEFKSNWTRGVNFSPSSTQW